ncbi:MAG: cyclic nucleotide-binding domain-containing protein, partial [Anaerolineales bacterium]
AGEAVFHEGDEGQHFYIVHRGQAQVLRQHGKEQEQISLLSPGDYFGETALMYGRRRSATIAALTDLELLQLSKEDFDNLLRRYPEIKPNLLVSVESRKIYRRLNLSWLNPNEVVYLIARRHVVLLVQALILPALAGGGVLALAFALWWFYFDLWALGILIFGSLAVAGWVWWVVTDWSNDYYIVTNQRVVYLEKIIGIYDSRQEAPLQFVLSVNTQTAGTIERALGIGDVIVRTFSGPIVMQAVANPQALAALVEEHWNRTKTREREAERDAMKQTVRRRVGLAPPEPPKPPAPPSPPKPPSVGQQLARFFSFKVRFELGESVVYRKHWYMLLRQIWEPSALILADLGLIGLKLGGILPAEWPLTMVVFIALVLFIPLAGWWLYQFVDWRNDIYQ